MNEGVAVSGGGWPVVRLRVLGTVDVEPGPGGPSAHVLLAKPKLTALTVYLLLARPGGWHRRDALVALFWPDSDQKRARASLSQALYQLRRLFGAAGIETRGTEEVRLADGVVGCDAADLRRALAAGDDRRACRLYVGELLPVFHLSDAPEFGHWLDGEREALRRAVIDAAWRAANAAEGAGDLAAAADGHRLAGALAVLDGVTVARAMAGLSRIREPTAALALFERHREALRTDLEQTPDPEVATLADEIRQAGVTTVPGLDVAPRAPRPAAADAPVLVPAPRRRRTAIAAVGIVGAVVLLLSQVWSFAPAGPADPSAVAVLPFTYEGTDTADRWLARALPVSIVPLLDGTGGLHAVPEARLGALMTARGIAWDDAITAADARALARRLGAGTYLTGYVLRDQEHRYVTAALTDLRSGDVRQQIRLSLDSLDVVEAAERVAGQLLIGLVHQQPRAKELLSESPGALRAYVDGWVARRETRYFDAVRDFQSAMEEDSTFALAALAYREAAMWLPDGTPHRLALEQADHILEQRRDRLSVPDQAVADAMLATYRLSSDGRTTLATVRRATLRAPDRPSAWMLLGDFLLHDGRMLALPDFTTLADHAFDSVRARGTLPEAERHHVEIRFALGDAAFARQYLAGHPRDSTTAFHHLRWTAAWLAGDSAATTWFGERLDEEPPETWRWILYWSQRAGVGFAHADRAAVLLHASTPLDESRRLSDGFLLRQYWTNRGRLAARGHAPRLRYAPTRLRPLGELEQALGVPEAWVNLDSLARRVAVGLDDLHPGDHLWAACDLGTWHALRGHRDAADSLAGILPRWADDAVVERAAVARTCPVVIRALIDTSAGLAAMHRADSVLVSEPAGTLRTDLTRWSLQLARGYANRGRADLGLPLTTRLGFIVEASAFEAPALLLEGELSLAVGDTARAARAYTRAAAFLTDPEPTVQAATAGIAELARRLAAAACGGDCGPYRP